ncbi:SET and MYND domain-containing protein 3 [Lobulomyces angularis]|nr:SET and MYND domain-containing protein 3 [Lobulomyces angularis]
MESEKSDLNNIVSGLDLVLEEDEKKYRMLKTRKRITTLERKFVNRSICFANECQLMDWKDSHSLLCSEVVDPELEMLVKLKLKDTQDTIYNTLMDHSDSNVPLYKKNQDIFFEKSKLAIKTLKKKKNKNFLFDDKFNFIRDLNIFKFNNFNLTDFQFFSIAEGCFPLGSLFNHSCCPNMFVGYRLDEQSFFSLRDIEIGEELFHTYIDPLIPKEERRNALFEKYNFWCECERCSGNAGNRKDGFHLIDVLIENSGVEEKLVENFFEKQDSKYLSIFQKKNFFDDLKIDSISKFNRLVFFYLLPHQEFEKFKLNLIEKKINNNFFKSRASFKQIFKIDKNFYETQHLNLIKKLMELKKIEIEEKNEFKLKNFLNLNSFKLISKMQFETLNDSQVNFTLEKSFFILNFYFLEYEIYSPLTFLQIFFCLKILWNNLNEFKTKREKEEALIDLFFLLLFLDNNFQAYFKFFVELNVDFLEIKGFIEDEFFSYFGIN